ncbi:unnamed protein product [Adineta steineri]|uniref:SH3 domain-containing protein n=2 Tax=Adineta steineri TaxID=433720 RepID=A0A818PHU3_9BILA|nr:unnamed protein product [Adineta steineri]CAF3625301.1 unnamed protein product [Adineta steineri]
MIEYTNRNKMEETTARVFARLHHMKSVLCKTIKKTPKFCGGISNRNGTYCSPTSYISTTDNDDDDNLYDPTITLTNIASDDTISSISGDSLDSGVSALSDFSHCSLLSSTSLLHRSVTLPQSCHLRCDPSVINYVSHNLLTTDCSECFLNEIDESSSSTQLPLAESSRRFIYENDPTIIADDEDEQIGPLTSTLVDRWHVVTKSYSAIFRQDLTVRKNELVQVLRCTHPHWVWVRNEESEEGYVPQDCLASSS